MDHIDVDDGPFILSLAKVKNIVEQAWLALGSSSNDFQMTFAFEKWVVEDNFFILIVLLELKLNLFLTVPDSY